MADDATPPIAPPSAPKKHPNYTAVFAAELIELARDGPAHRRRSRPGMPTGTGLSKFQAEFPDRFFDVGIAEQHAVTLATGLAMGGMRPVVALYSTFLQRAFDQTVHDVCQNDQPVLLAVDRAGLVGEDGTSHQGMFTLPAQRQLPNLVIASPKDEQELRSLLRTAFAQDHPFALHYPRDAGLRPAAGRAVGPADRAGRGPARGPRPAVRRLRADRGARPSRPPTRSRPRAGRSASSTPGSPSRSTAQLILDQARGKRLVVTFEESVVTGGFGSGVLELIEEARLTDPALRDVAVRIVGIPGDRFVDHGSVDGPAARAPPRRAGPRRAGPRDARVAAGSTPGRRPAPQAAA